MTCINTKYVKFRQTKVQYAEYRNNKHLRMETETFAHGNPSLNPTINKYIGLS